MPSLLPHIGANVRLRAFSSIPPARGAARNGALPTAGRLACKWNVFADLFAVAEKLIADKVTEPAKLAMMRNGGLLAAYIVHRPELGGVSSSSSCRCSIRRAAARPCRIRASSRHLPGDYADPADAVLGKVTYSYSPYHNIRSDTGGLSRRVPDLRREGHGLPAVPWPQVHRCIERRDHVGPPGACGPKREGRGARTHRCGNGTTQYHAEWPLS
ncbi:MAG: hypothetical protein U1F25_02395 [Rubrivivax sp.]